MSIKTGFRRQMISTTFRTAGSWSKRSSVSIGLWIEEDLLDNFGKTLVANWCKFWLKIILDFNVQVTWFMWSFCGSFCEKMVSEILWKTRIKSASISSSLPYTARAQKKILRTIPSKAPCTKIHFFLGAKSVSETSVSGATGKCCRKSS